MRRAHRLALAVTVSAGLYATAMAFGPLAAPLTLFVPLPGLLLATLAPLSEFLLWMLLTAGAVALPQGPAAAAGFVLSLGLPSLVLTLGAQRLWRLERTLVAAVLAWCVGVGCIVLFAYGGVSALVVEARQQLAQGFDVALSARGSLGLGEDAVATLAAERDTMITALVEIMPAVVVIVGAVMVLANLGVLRRWTGVWHTVNLRGWRTPDVLIWALIASGFAMFTPVYAVAVVARNAFLVFLGCYFCQGLAIVSYYLERFQLPRGLRIASYLLIAAQQIVAAVVLALGVFDLWANFRRLGASPEGVPFDGEGE